jgi:hypothetical protein
VISTCDLDMTITVQVQWYKQTRDAPMTDKNTSEDIYNIVLVIRGKEKSTRVLCVGSHNYITSSIMKHYTHTVQLQLKHLA